MSCLSCGTAHQRGRFCNRCGGKMPPAARVGRRVSLARPRPLRAEADARPPGAPSVAAGGAAPPAPAEGDGAPAPTGVQRMYDAAMARAAVHGRLPLQRYLAVLTATP